jgi:hypothetical protein
MCKKLMFLISLVLLLGVAVGAYADNLEVDWPDTYTVSGTEEYDEVRVHGTLIVPSGATLLIDEESELDGNGGDGDGGTEYARFIVDGGVVEISDRLNIGKDHDGYLIIINGGSFLQYDNSDGIKLPDDDGGMHVISLNNGGTLEAERVELIDYREGWVEMGAGCTITLHSLDDGIGDDREDPGEWLNQGHLTAIPPTQIGDIDIEYINGGDDGAIVTTPMALEEWATNPNPADGATGVKCVTTEVELSWAPGSGVYGTTKGRHFIFFGTDKQAVEDAPTYEFGWTPPDEYKGWLPAPTTTYNVGNLPLWENRYWRIDEGPESGGVVKGLVWTFTTGCPLINGDLNLDCLLNAEDYAILLETWKEEQYFPWD